MTYESIPSDPHGAGLGPVGPTGYDAFESRTTLRRPELGAMDLGTALDTLTEPESIAEQVEENMGIIRASVDPDRSATSRRHVEIMDAASSKGADVFVTTTDTPEGGLVARLIEDAPRSSASAYDYAELKGAAHPPKRTVILEGPIEVRAGDFVLPAVMTDGDIAQSAAVVRDLEASGQTPMVTQATALVQPDGSIVYLYRGGNIPLAAIASMSRGVEVRGVEVYKADADALIAQARQPVAAEDVPDEYAGVGQEDVGSAEDWRGAGPAPALRQRTVRAAERPAPPATWFFVM